jgi:hypothetical protein
LISRRTNEEVRQLYGELGIVTEITKKGRLRWLGHVERMSEERAVKRLYQNTPEGSSVGRPRLRWMDDVREDLRKMGVTDWRIHARRRYRLEDTCTQKVQTGGYVHTEGTDWKMVVKETKVLQGL